MPDTRRRMASFTLLEVLIVITIISILAAMLMPALQKAREKARQSVCMNNLKQVGSVLMMYAQDYNGYLPPIANSSSQEWTQMLSLGGYLKPSNVLVCPSYYPHRFQGSAWWCTYGIRQLGIHAYMESWNESVGSFQTAQKKASLSKILLLADSIRTDLAVPTQVYRFDPAGGYAYYVHLRHTGRANCLFYDLHVESCGNVNEMGWQSGGVGSGTDFSTYP